MHLLRFALVTTAYTVVVFDQLRVAVHLFQAKQASIRCVKRGPCQEATSV